MLRKLQRDFLDYTFGATDDIDAATGHPQIYRNNTRLILTDLLKNAFPAVTKLVDERFMNHAAREFIGQFPPASPDMTDYGAAFPDFLENFPPVKDHPYLADLARLEWLCQETYLSPDGANHTLSSAWPVVDIWLFALKDAPAPDMTRGEYLAMTVRRGDTVEVLRLDKATF